MSRSLLSALTCIATLLGSAALSHAQSPATDSIGFNGIPAGARINRVYSNSGAGPIFVNGFNPTFGSGVNAALTFDSANPTGGDDDLGTPNETFGGPGIGADGEMGMRNENSMPHHGVLIVGENFVDADNDSFVDDPDDADAVGSYLELDFTKVGPVEIQAITFIDGESDRTGAQVELYDANRVLVSTTVIELPGNNGVSTNRLVPASAGVVRMIIRLNGSGAIDDVCFAPYVDCNDNGVSDYRDISTGTSQDCNGNRIPDECEPDCDNDGTPDDCEVDCNNNGIPDDCESFTDCNSNDIPDECDIASGTSNDLNGNGTPDECEPDCNSNGIPDDHDIATGVSGDCNMNGTPDECEPDCDNDGTPDMCETDCNGNGTPDDCESITDCNMNGTPDECDIASGTSNDVNSNGIPDECEPDCNSNGIPDDHDISTGNSNDCNMNGTPDECEPDCDADGIPDTCEADCNLNGTPDDCEGLPDCNRNGVPDVCDISSGTSNDVNGNGTPDECETDCNGNGIPDDHDISTGTSNDCNSNGIPDECEPDCDNDGTPDDCEADCNNNGTPDDCETFVDCNSNDIPDECDIASGTSNDVNGNGIPDECEPDCNSNGIPDDHDISTGTSNDCNSNGIPDDCEPDCDNDGTIDDCEVDCNNNGTPDDCESFTDCNANDIPDECDIASGSSNDANGNGIPDECETDCDSNGIPDDLDIANGATDCNGNGIPDVCEPDCDNDGTIDACEADCDADGVPDDCENDCNGNGIPDDCEGCADTIDLLWDMDDCLAFDDYDNFSEFVATSTGACANVAVSATHVDEFNGGHSCTDDAIDGTQGDAFCVQADSDTFYDIDESDDMLRFSVTITETDGETARLLDFSFWHNAPWVATQSSSDGYFGTVDNNPPEYYGIRVLRDGSEIFFQDAVLTERNWTLHLYDFSSDPNFQVSATTATFQFELMAYAPIASGANAQIWDLDEFQMSICCSDGAPGDCDGDGIADFCEADCNNNGIPDDCDIMFGTSMDNDLDGVPDECQVCVAPSGACDAGCWDLGNKVTGSIAPPDYGLRLAGLFQDQPNEWTFDFEAPGTEVNACYDGNGTLTVQGIAFGGLDIGGAWDPVERGFLEIDFTYTGVTCSGSELVADEGLGAAGRGSVTWVNTGQVIVLGTKANGAGELMTFDGNDFTGWISYPGGDSSGTQDFASSAAASTDCPPGN